MKNDYDEKMGGRLTARSKEGCAYYPACFEEPCNGCGCENPDCEFSALACEKLCRYEETSITPEDIKSAFNEDAVLKLAAQVLKISPEQLRALAALTEKTQEEAREMLK